MTLHLDEKVKSHPGETWGGDREGIAQRGGHVVVQMRNGSVLPSIEPFR